jgi:hypothetical protein
VYRLLEIMDENEAECVKPFRAFSRTPLRVALFLRFGNDCATA